MTSAVVVGAGPNGLAAAVVLAKAGLEVTVLEAENEIGGGTRSSELTVPGVLHDECAGMHPSGAASPLFRNLQLDRFGLRWLWAELDCAHPQQDGNGAALYRDIRRTTEELGRDGPLWRRMFTAPVSRLEELGPEMLQPVLHVPAHPILLARFGLMGLPPATMTAKLFRSVEGRGLFAGAISHAIHPFNRPLTPTVGMGIVTMGHRHGWPVAQGGSRAITDALAAALQASGGRIVTGTRVSSLNDLPKAAVTMLDLSPRAVAAIAGDHLPSRIRRAYSRYRPASAAFKVDYAVREGVPWTYEPARRAGTVHVGGTFEQIAAAEASCARGIMPARPFVLVGQQYLADPIRSAGDIHPVYAYAHVPYGYRGPGVVETITNQIERFAPGFRESIVAVAHRSPDDLARHNSNYLGGDIIGGASSATQLISRPRLSIDPYRTGIKGVYICSHYTPPGAGVHGMCGYHAAQSALRSLHRKRQ